MIELNNIHKVYRSGAVETVALNAVNLSVAEGEFVAVMGPSGCGKSTLLNILGLLDTPDSGSYLFRGSDVSRSNERRAAALRKANVGFIFQNFNLIDELTVAENVELALLYQKLPARLRQKRVADAMDMVGIGHRARHRPGQLSGGQQQRVAVARAIVGKQSLLLADEPTGNLDSAHGKDIMDILQGLNANGTTIVMVTHSPSHADYAHRTINLFDGAVVAESRFGVRV